MLTIHIDEDDEPRVQRRLRHMRCADGMCGADDCPRCRPWNFRGGVFVDDIEESEEQDENGTH